MPLTQHTSCHATSLELVCRREQEAVLYTDSRRSAADPAKVLRHPFNGSAFAMSAASGRSGAGGEGGSIGHEPNA